MDKLPQEAVLQAYLDGACTPQEKAWVEQAIANDSAMQAEWQLLLTTHKLLQQDEPLAPGMRFTQNVMDAIAALPAKSKPRHYLHPAMVYGLLGTLAALLLLIVGYAALQQGTAGLLSGYALNQWLPAEKLERLSLPQDYQSGAIFTLTLLLLLLIDHWLRLQRPAAKRGA